MVRFENFFRDGDYLEADVIAIDAGNARYHAISIIKVLGYGSLIVYK